MQESRGLGQISSLASAGTARCLSPSEVLAIAGFFASFWTWGYSRGKTGFWAQVVNDMWATRVITLSTAIPRLCRAAQMLLCCYMLASMALESGQIREQGKEMMTVFQRGNEGPISMCWMFSKHDVTRSRTPRGSSPLP